MILWTSVTANRPVVTQSGRGTGGSGPVRCRTQGQEGARTVRMLGGGWDQDVATLCLDLALLARTC